jgi:hypothetical protein
VLMEKGRAFGAGEWVAWVLVWCDAAVVVWASSRVWRSGVSLRCISAPDQANALTPNRHSDTTYYPSSQLIVLLFLEFQHQRD